MNRDKSMNPIAAGAANETSEAKLAELSDAELEQVTGGAAVRAGSNTGSGNAVPTGSATSSTPTSGSSTLT